MSQNDGLNNIENRTNILFNEISRIETYGNNINITLLEKNWVNFQI